MPRRKRKQADLRVYFGDEVPRIGCGWRGIDIVTLGRKWVRIKELGSGRAARLKRPVWDQLKLKRMEHMEHR
jgi:hypothetical protein